jgi:CheY-like chemotaxis protein
MDQKTRKCLIIDDDPDDQEIFLMCVRKVSNNIECRAVDNGEDALVMLRYENQYTPDYIFLDINMPRMNGIDCLRNLKTIRRLEHTKIIMYSTSSQSTILDDTAKMGAYDFVVKPARVSELKEKLSNIFNIVSGINT